MIQIPCKTTWINNYNREKYFFSSFFHSKIVYLSLALLAKWNKSTDQTCTVNTCPRTNSAMNYSSKFLYCCYGGELEAFYKWLKQCVIRKKINMLKESWFLTVLVEILFMLFSNKFYPCKAKKPGNDLEEIKSWV